MNLNKKQLLKQTISLLLIVAITIPMFTRVSSCCDKSEKYSCSEKNSDSIQFEKNCDLCDFQFSSLSFYTPKEIDFIVFKKIITDDNQPILPQYSSFYVFNKQLRAPPVYSS